jgi:hypothetical protein
MRHSKKKPEGREKEKEKEKKSHWALKQVNYPFF